MSRISTALEKIFESNEYLQFGMHNKLFNMKQLAHYIRPGLSESVGKDMSIEATQMALSRFRNKGVQDKSGHLDRKIFNRLFIQNDLCVLTFPKTTEIHRQIGGLFSKIQADEGYITVSEGTSEITTIFDARYLKDLQAVVQSRPRRINHKVCGVGLKFKMELLDEPGLIYRTLEQLYLKRISLIEITSTNSELNLYVKEKDARKAMDTLYYRFMD